MKKINITKDELYMQYMFLDKSVRECAEHFNCSQSTVRKSLKLYDIYKIEFK